MNLQMKSNVQNHRSASRGKTQQARRSAGRREESIFSNIKPAAMSANERSFFEDFNLEHSLSRISITQIAISARASALKPATPAKNYAYDLNPPNCVYVG